VVTAYAALIKDRRNIFAEGNFLDGLGLPGGVSVKTRHPDKGGELLDSHKGPVFQLSRPIAAVQRRAALSRANGWQNVRSRTKFALLITNESAFNET
jgi:hypothetical protein